MTEQFKPGDREQVVKQDDLLLDKTGTIVKKSLRGWNAWAVRIDGKTYDDGDNGDWFFANELKLLP